MNPDRNQKEYGYTQKYLISVNRYIPRGSSRKCISIIGYLLPLNSQQIFCFSIRIFVEIHEVGIVGIFVLLEIENKEEITVASCLF